ncbi:MAG: ATP-binding protein [Sulfuricurvum sp.]
MMSEFFVQKVLIKEVRGITDFEIPLDEEERKHLIITGKNGCGKTSTLDAIDTLLNQLIDNQFARISQNKKNIESYKKTIDQFRKNIENYQKQINTYTEQKNGLVENEQTKHQIAQIEATIQSFTSNIINERTNIQSYENQIIQGQKQIDDFSKVELIFSNQWEIYENIVNGKFILAYLDISRLNKPNDVKTPTKQEFKAKYSTTEVLNKTFLQYLVNLKTNQAFAQIEKDMQKVENIEKWFNRFTNALKEIFDKNDLKIVFNYEKYDFKIEYDNKSFGFGELSSGYSSLLAIVTELILRMEAHGVEAYDMQGVVLIDEIENHLHVELQKKVLPFLTGFFPEIQFIVTTHSPFVLSSLSNAVICDLERKEIVDSERFVNASYSQILKNYFEVDSEFSRILVNEIKKYEDLITLFENGRLDVNQEKELLDLDLKLDRISPMLSNEIYLRFKEAQGKIQTND